MAGIGIVLAWFGYAVSYYGLNILTGGNESFMSLIWPGRYTPVPRDSGSPAAAGAGQVGGQAPTYNPSTGQSVPGTGVAPGAGTGPGGTGYGTGNAPGYQPPGGYYSA